MRCTNQFADWDGTGRGLESIACMNSGWDRGMNRSPAQSPHLLELRQQLGQEGRGIVRVLDELGHVVNDDGGLALDGGGALTQAAHQQRHDDGQRAALHRLDEGGGCQLVDAVGGLSLQCGARTNQTPRQQE